MANRLYGPSLVVLPLISSCALVLSAGSIVTATAATPVLKSAIRIPFDPTRWQVQGNANFITREGTPLGILTLSGTDPHLAARLKGLSFRNGIIEFDAKADSNGEVSIHFRRRDDGNSEVFYIRVQPDCPVSQDCLQYTPDIHGRNLWDTYIRYQRSGAFIPDQWNHVKLVVSGRRMNVYINRQQTPALEVGRLEGEATVGDIALGGPATYANLVLVPNEVEGLSPLPEADPTAHDRRYIRSWEAAPPSQLAEGSEPGAADVPSDSAAWRAVGSESYGLINLARIYPPTPNDHVKPIIGWLRTRLFSDRDTVKHMSIGFLREVWVFADGRLVYSDKNLYNTVGKKKIPGGRISTENGSFELPLHKGQNNIVVAVRSNSSDLRGQYGWGIELRQEG